MKKLTYVKLMMLVISLSFFIHACNKDDDDPEFVANDSTFAGFSSWSLDFTATGADPALGGMAHGGNDSTVTREVFYKDGQNPVNGEYPVGTVIVKRSTNPAGSVEEYTAMVKRGAGFNADHNDWEWFMLMGDGTIGKDQDGMPMRGAMLMNGMCGSCHGGAQVDFVFSKP